MPSFVNALDLILHLAIRIVLPLAAALWVGAQVAHLAKNAGLLPK